MTPYRRCFYLDERGQQCEAWFAAETEDKLCPAHRGIAIITNGENKINKIKYIDLANNARAYAYHFRDGRTQEQNQELIFQFKDDMDGSIFEKLDHHLAFLECVLQDIKIKLSETRAVKTEKMNDLTEDQREELRKIKIEKIFKTPDKIPSMKKDPIAYLMKTKGMSEEDAKKQLSLDPEELIAMYKLKKELKEKLNS